MIHSSWPWEAPRSTASSCWATFRPDTEATTATSAVHMAMRMWRWRRGSATTPDGAASGTEAGGDVGGTAVERGMMGGSGRGRSVNGSEKQYETVSY